MLFFFFSLSEPVFLACLMSGTPLLPEVPVTVPLGDLMSVPALVGVVGSRGE